MSTIKVNKIENTATTDGGVAIDATGHVTVDGVQLPTAGALSNRNLIINGAMQVAQRGTSSTDTGYRTVDRISHFNGGTNENPTYAQADVASGTTPYTLGFRKSFKITNGNQTGGADAGDYIHFVYKVEAQDLANSGWNYASSSSFITLSFWVKSSVSQNFYGYLLTSDGSTRSFAFETGSLTANTWTKVTVVVPGNSNLTFNNDTGNGLEIDFSAFRGTNFTGAAGTVGSWVSFTSSQRHPDCTSTWYTTNDATFEVTGVQLEVGEKATPFEHRSFGDELARCQRYFCKSFNYTTAPANGITGDGEHQIQLVASGDPQIVVYWPVQMRADPTVSLYNPRSGGASGQWSTNLSDSSNTRSFSQTPVKTIIDNTDNSLSATYWRIAWSASAEL
ncbi:putative carbohydrate binding domain containing protein [uncultured phage_MedDCM-OCT-S45-C4]|uniref:Putative carbohydrate binding domain containing protein n=1 Tax=uncultured phage_MedDCM-OCT-S45-C4 TaxID=2740801 RepID=A0A6S4PL66_9CAUD|nr:tail fiber protein [uncultured phage_MedDCM-OCT-S45-C4]BAQ93964.1 putative carbohydrate binding domain containing protein [uncultured phage_MedDCM-OCT-S45-C4]